MTSLVIDQLSPEVLEALDRRAQAKGRTLAEEARALIERSLSLDTLAARAAAFRAAHGDAASPSVVDMIREDRDTR